MKKRTHQADKLAKVYDAQIVPVWSQRFGRLLLRGLELPPKAIALDVDCATGEIALELLRKVGSDGRIVAIDSSSPLLDQARAKAGALSGRRIFFRSESAIPRLPFANDVYDLVVSNAALHEFAEPERAVAEFARVAKSDGLVVVTVPLAGTFAEFFDIFREVLLQHDQTEALERLDAYLTCFPPLEQVMAWFEDAQLDEIRTEWETFTLLFKSAREFFFAPVIEYGPLSDWKAIAGQGQLMQRIFWQVKEAIDSYFRGSSFAVTVHAGCVRGHKRGHKTERISGGSRL